LSPLIAARLRSSASRTAALPDERVDPPLHDLLLAHALAHLLGLGVPAGRQVLGGGDDALDLEHVGVVRRMAAPQIGHDRLQQRQDRARPDRIARRPVARVERAGVVHDRQLLTLEHAAVLLAEHGQEHLLVQLRFRRVPVDVEERRERRAAPVLQHVVPPVVVRAGDAHVVGDDVHDEASRSPSVPISGFRREWSMTS
jgi:hypothetical protein